MIASPERTCRLAAPASLRGKTALRGWSDDAASARVSRKPVSNQLGIEVVGEQVANQRLRRPVTATSRFTPFTIAQLRGRAIRHARFGEAMTPCEVRHGSGSKGGGDASRYAPAP